MRMVKYYEMVELACETRAVEEKIASELVVNLVFNFGSIFASEVVVYALVAEQRIGIEMELP